MRVSTKHLFLLLIVSQALHSFEELYFQLWEVLTPARAVSGLFSDDLTIGFLIANSLIVFFGFWCYLGPVAGEWRSAAAFMWFWALLELANGIGHTLFAVIEKGYFPGAYTAPMLLVFSLFLMHRLLKGSDVFSA